MGETDPSPGVAGTYVLQLPLTHFDNGLAFHHITSGEDPEPPSSSVLAFLPGCSEAAYLEDGRFHLADMLCVVHFYYQFSTSPYLPSARQLDLRTVLLHEFTHGLGFSAGATVLGGVEIGGETTKFSDFLYTGNGKKLWNSETGWLEGTEDELTGSDGGVVFDGPRVRELQGEAEPVYAPDSYNPKSSLSHWAVSGEGAWRSVMEPGIAAGEVCREYTAKELAALADLGYRVDRL